MPVVPLKPGLLKTSTVGNVFMTREETSQDDIRGEQSPIVGTNSNEEEPKIAISEMEKDFICQRCVEIAPTTRTRNRARTETHNRFREVHSQ